MCCRDIGKNKSEEIRISENRNISARYILASDGSFMRKKRWENKLAQFGYDHQNLNTQFVKVRKSAGELSRMLDDLPPKNNKKSEDEEK